MKKQKQLELRSLRHDLVSFTRLTTCGILFVKSIFNEHSVVNSSSDKVTKLHSCSESDFRHVVPQQWTFNL